MDEAFKTGDPAFITRLLGAVARARGMTRVAQEAGMSRESLYRALGEKGNPEFATVVRVMQATGCDWARRLRREAATPRFN